MVEKQCDTAHLMGGGWEGRGGYGGGRGAQIYIEIYFYILRKKWVKP